MVVGSSWNTRTIFYGQFRDIEWNVAGTQYTQAVNVGIYMDYTHITDRLP